MKHKLLKLHGNFVVAALLLWALAFQTASGQVLPPSTQPYGFSYSDWAARWWQWTLEQSTNHMNLVSEPVSGPVRFLAGAAGTETVTNSVTVPAGTSLFFPILSIWVDNSGCPDFSSNTLAELQAQADGEWSSVTVTTCIIDGVPVSGLDDPQTSDYFVQATPFSYTTAATNSVVNSIYGEPCLPAGTTIDPAVADGVFLMLSPLGQGTHTVEFIGAAGPTNAPFVALDLTYEITVPSPAGVFPPGGTPFGKSYADWAAAWWEWTLSQSTNQIQSVSTPVAGVAFLAGAANSDTETRNITVSSGDALFFPILSAWVDNSGCPTFTTNSLEELQAEADGDWSAVTVTTCTVDGVPVSGLGDPQTSGYFTQAAPFTYTTALSNSVVNDIYGEPCIPGGTTIGPAVADGVFMMLAPLAPGQHTIEFVGIVGPTNAPYLLEDLTYQITVVPDTGVYSARSLPAGKSYADWSAAWWQWTLSQSTNQTAWVSSPMAGSVAFLAGAAGTDTETRDVTIPAGVSLFFPILSIWVDNSGCPDFTTNTLDQLEAEAQEDWSGVTETACTIDGVPVPGLENPQYSPYLTQSLPFSYTTALTNSVLGPVYGEPCIPGSTTIGPAVAEGVYLMVPPMTAGNHTINFTGIVGPATAPYLAVNLTYNIAAQPPALSISTLGSGVELSWPQSQSSYIVETATNLASPAWSPFGAPVLASNGVLQVTVPTGSGSQYFRLRGQ